MTKALLALGIAYVALAVMLYFGQERLLFPAPQVDRGPLSDYETITYQTDDGIAITGGYRAPQNGKLVVVFFHGNAADWQSGAAALRPLAEQGYGAFAASYRGYAGNAGSPGEAGFYKDGEAVIAWLGDKGITPENIVLVGNSVGSGPASELATRYPVKGLALISPFSAMTDIVGERVWWMPTGLLLRHRFVNREKLPDIAAPVLLIHGTDDRVIPVAHARRLAEIRPDAEFVIAEGAGHDLAYLPQAQAALAQWLDGL